MDKDGICWHCGHTLSASDYTREGECRHCRHQTHVCRNCRFYAPGRANDCLEPIAEPVSDKQRANFCDYFEPGKDGYQPQADGEQLKANADALFDL